MAQTPPLFPKVGIVGVGLIGGSIGLALKAKGLTHQVLGAGRTPSNLQTALDLGQIDEATDLISLTQQADLIIICVPVSQTLAIFEAIVPHLKPTAIVIDAGSTKMDIITYAKDAFAEKVGQMIACHPIAGGAQHGPRAAKVDLFESKQLIICPILENTPGDIEKVATLWETLGATVFKMSALEHDHIFAAVSHLPHLLSYAMMLQVTRAMDADKKFMHAGAGFRDFTRIAASSPEMWTDIALANRPAILSELDGFLKIIEQMKLAITEQDGQKLQKMFQLASESRNKWQG
jgi:prephenate dehydrogenase